MTKEAQMEFPFAREVEDKDAETRDLMQEISEDSKTEFISLMEKYKISERDSQRIFLAANQMKLTE